MSVNAIHNTRLERPTVKGQKKGIGPGMESPYLCDPAHAWYLGMTILLRCANSCNIIHPIRSYGRGGQGYEIQVCGASGRSHYLATKSGKKQQSEVLEKQENNAAMRS